MISKTDRQLRLLAVGLSALTLLSANGCGEKVRPMGSVAGHVTFKGQPLPRGIIAFRAEDGVGGSGTIQNGEYTVESAPVGPVTVTITTPPPAGSVKQTQKMMGRRGGTAPPGEVHDMGAVEAQEKTLKIPGKYADPKTSGLTYEVTTGHQTKDFPLD